MMLINILLVKMKATKPRTLSMATQKMLSFHLRINCQQKLPSKLLEFIEFSS